MAILTTTRLALPYPNGAENNNPPEDIGALAQAIDPIMAVDLQSANLNDRPVASKTGRYFTHTATGLTYRDNGSAWVLVNDIKRTIRTAHSWAIGGLIRVAVGQTDYFPPFFVSMASGETQKLAKMRARINGGTSATLTVRRRSAGGTVTNVITGWVVDTIDPGESIDVDPDLALAEDDRLEVVVTAVSGAPANLSVTLFIDHTA